MFFLSLKVWVNLTFVDNGGSLLAGILSWCGVSSPSSQLDIDVRILPVEADHLILNPGSTIYCEALGKLVSLTVSHFLTFKGE